MRCVSLEGNDAVEPPNRSLPGGEPAESLEAYFAAWDALKLPIEKALGLQTVAYDPGLLLRDPETNSILDMSVGMAMKLAAALTPPPAMQLYCVHSHGPDWSMRHWVRAEDGGKAIRYVRNQDQEFYNYTGVKFSVRAQDETKGHVFCANYG